jgi:Ca-activated chloride channel family protein
MKPLPTLSLEDLNRLQTALGAEPDREAGFGALATERGPLPLKALDVAARVDGLLVEIRLSQTFFNTHEQPLEATYIFPLPDRAAVTRFRLEVAGRVVEGELKERGQARRDYDQAIKAGHRAAITEEERPGVFTLRVGNLPPGEAATVRLTLTGPLPLVDGEATFRFPLVVAPRYIPGTPLPGPSVGDGVASDTDAVPDASRISPPVLLPGFPNPVRLSMAVEFAASGLPPIGLRSSLHAVAEQREGRFRRVELLPDERLDRDFILRWQLGDAALGAALSVQPDEKGDEGTFALTLTPPRKATSNARPRDLVFVLDRSGSMGGWKMVAARRAMARMVETLTDADRFAVYAFDDRIETPRGFDQALTQATAARRNRAVEFLNGVESRGGTEMAQPLDKAVAELSRELSTERDRVLVLATDGQLGHEDQILRQLGKRLKGIRVFTLGIDQAVNAAFLKRLADLGGGACSLVESEERLDDVMDQIHRRIAAPVLTELKLEPAGLAVVPGSWTPVRLPDLFEGSPVVILGRYKGSPKGSIALQGRDPAGRMWSDQVKAAADDSPMLSSVWARGRLRDLEDRYVIGGGATAEKEILKTSLRFGVLCRFTSFVAVDRTEVVNQGGQVQSIVQPVEQPAGWEMRKALGAGPVFACAAPAPAALEALDHALDLAEDGGPANTDCVESYLSIAPRKAAPGSARRSRGASGFIGKVRSLFKSKKEALEPTPEELRQQIERFLQDLRSATANGRHDWLRQHLPVLEKLLTDLEAATVERTVVQQFHAAFQEVKVLLSTLNPTEAAVEAAWTKLETALAACQTELTPSGDRREGFWKC